MKEFTYSMRSGSAVLTLERKQIPKAELTMGQRVFVPTLLGYFEATVHFEDAEHAYAETDGMVCPLHVEDGVWWCDSSISKGALKTLGKKAR